MEWFLFSLRFCPSAGPHQKCFGVCSYINLEKRECRILDGNERLLEVKISDDTKNTKFSKVEVLDLFAFSVVKAKHRSAGLAHCDFQKGLCLKTHEVEGHSKGLPTLAYLL